MEGSQYCVLWNNYHGTLIDTIGVLQRGGHLIDVTVVCSDGQKVNVHQLILAACSSFFKDFILGNPSNHPIVLLPSEIKFPELKAMIEFMYTGQVCIQQDRLQAFVRGAKYLKIKGLEDSTEDSEAEDLIYSDNEKEKSIENKTKRNNLEKEATVDQESVPITTIKGKKVRDHRYTQQVDLGDSDENRDQWEMVDRKPVIFPKSNSTNSCHRKRRRRVPSLRKVPMHLSNNIICYEQKEREYAYDKDEPINKVRRPEEGEDEIQTHSKKFEFIFEKIPAREQSKVQLKLTWPAAQPILSHNQDEETDICSCTARKTWSVKDTEALLKAWMETLLQVPPSYFIRSISLCREVAKRLQAKGVQKNWRQCQVKMKNLRREVRIFKKSQGRSTSRKPSEVANACEKLLTSIEDIFNKEEEIRREWYEKKGARAKDDDAMVIDSANSNDILAQVAALADSDICDEDTDGPPIETEGEGGTYTEVEDCVDSFVNSHEGGPHHRMHTGPDGTVVHHIVEDISLHGTMKEEPSSATDAEL